MVVSDTSEICKMKYEISAYEIDLLTLVIVGIRMAAAGFARTIGLLKFRGL